MYANLSAIDQFRHGFPIYKKYKLMIKKYVSLFQLTDICSNVLTVSGLRSFFLYLAIAAVGPCNSYAISSSSLDNSRLSCLFMALVSLVFHSCTCL